MKAYSATKRSNLESSEGSTAAAAGPPIIPVISISSRIEANFKAFKNK